MYQQNKLPKSLGPFHIGKTFENSNMYHIVSLSDTRKERLLYYTSEEECFIILHWMCKRIIELSNKCNTIDTFQLKIAYIIILDRNITIFRGSIVRTNKAVNIQELV